MINVINDERRGSVLVTGGRGFIGRSLGKLLEQHGYRAVSLDTTPIGARFNEVVCDVTDLAALERLFQEEPIGAIVHLAAILPTAAQRDPWLASQVNILGSVNLVKAASQFHVRRFVFGSSLSVYGTCPAGQVVSEKDRAAPEDLYGAAKLYVEQLGDAYRQAHGVEFVSLRIGRVVGPGARSATSAWRSHIFQCLSNGGPAEIGIPYAESERILLVHVEDVARMLLHLLQAKAAYSVYNAACDSVLVGELKREVERLNPHVRVRLGGQVVAGNPRRVDWSRFGGEFGFLTVPMFEQLAQAARRGNG